MKLLVDVGNSSVKWCIESEGNLLGFCSFPYDVSVLNNLLETEWTRIKTPEKIIVSNVAGKSVRELMDALCDKFWKIRPVYIRVSEQACGVKNGYREISQLGTDRWAAVIAAWQIYKKAACVVDCGTAMTIDAISPEGEYMGGLILPGLELMQRSLSVKTDALDMVKDTKKISEFSDNTEQGQVSGCILSMVALIEHMYNHMNTIFGNDLVGIASGSGFYSLKGLLKNKFEFHEDLVLKGLSYLSGDCS